MSTVPAPILIDRTDIHKSCKALEAIVTVLNSYTEAADTLATIQKRLAKALKEAASVKSTNSVPANAMVNSAGIFESLAEVDTKFAKLADKEAESVGNDLKKWFKKLAKEEKAHDERISNANAKIKQAGQAYEKKAKKKDHDASEEHNRYVAVLSSIGPEMSQDKYNHSLLVTQRHTLVLSGFSASLSRLAEAEWGRACENVRRCASVIGTVGEWRALCEGGWSGPVPGNLPDLGITGPQRDQVNNNAADKTNDVPRALMSLQSTNVEPNPTAHTSEHPDSPAAPMVPKPLPSTGRSSEVHSATDISNSSSVPSRPPSPSLRNETSPNLLKQKTMKSESVNVSPPVIKAADSRDALTTEATIKRSLNALVDGSDGTRVTEKDLISPDQRSPIDHNLNTEDSPKPKARAPSLPRDPPPSFSSQESFAGEKNQLHTPKKGIEFMDDQEHDGKFPPSSPVRPAESGRHTNTGGDLNRRLSVESSMSTNSLVAAMRDRYDSLPMKSSSPPPRDLPRLQQSVTDLATRYTPVDSQSSPHRTNPTSSPQLASSAERFPASQDRYLRNTVDRSERNRDRHRIPPHPSGSVEGYFEAQDKDRYQYIESPTVDRNRFLRDDRDRERYRATIQPRSPDHNYLDEFGIRERQRRIDTVEEMMLQEREEALLEKERQLDLERARITSAREREAGYGSDTTNRHRSPYGVAMRSESPGPVAPRQLLRPSAPAEHAPNCGCQRCSARHYASSTPSLPRMGYDSHSNPEQGQQQSPVFKPDPPIQLRPEKPKNWIRRMSMPLVSSSDKKSSTVGQGSRANNMALPEEDGRSARRSFERDREVTDRFGTRR